MFAVGDIAWITDTKTDDVLPQLGSVALQAGAHAGENIAHLIAGKEDEALPLSRQGHDGDHRSGRSRCSAAARIEPWRPPAPTAFSKVPLYSKLCAYSLDGLTRRHDDRHDAGINSRGLVSTEKVLFRPAVVIDE